jgi:ATP-dependent DNA ligase
VLLYAFDLIELNGDDLRPLPLEQRKGKLERLLAGLNEGAGNRAIRTKLVTRPGSPTLQRYASPPSSRRRR